MVLRYAPGCARSWTSSGVNGAVEDMLVFLMTLLAVLAIAGVYTLYRDDA